MEALPGKGKCYLGRLIGGEGFYSLSLGSTHWPGLLIRAPGCQNCFHIRLSPHLHSQAPQHWVAPQGHTQLEVEWRPMLPLMALRRVKDPRSQHEILSFLYYFLPLHTPAPGTSGRKMTRKSLHSKLRRNHNAPHLLPLPSPIPREASF